MTLSLIADGDRFDPVTGAFSILKAREDIMKVGYYYEAGDIFAVDVFGPGVLADMAEQLVDSPELQASGLAFAGRAAVQQPRRASRSPQNARNRRVLGTSERR